MDDSQEPSYYEIALTNRQVLVFFVVLLVCVVGAFFSGIWLGQQRAAAPPAVAQTAGEAPLPEEGDEPLAELNFFTDEQSSPSRPAVKQTSPPESRGEPPGRESSRKPETIASAGSPATTLLEDLSGSERQESPSEQPASGSSAGASPASAPQPSAPTSRAPSSSEGGFVIQVFSSPDGDQARKVLDRLTSGGYEAFISPVEVDGRVMHRVRVGPFDGKDEAETVATRVTTAFQLDTWVTPND